MVDKGFLRIAFGLITLVVVSAAAVGIYLYYNFNAQSRLPLIVPQSANWFVQVQTKKIKEDYTGNKPPYYDSFYQLIANADVFKGCADAGTPGLGLFSDVVLFETDKAKFLGLSVSSESKLSAFLDALKSSNKVHGKINNPNFTYVKIVGRNLYVAYKYKAMVFMEPFDTTENVTFNEKALSEVFSGKESKFMHNKLIQELYDKDAHVIWYHRHKAEGTSKLTEMSVGFNMGQQNLQVFSLGSAKHIESKSPLLNQCAAFTGYHLFDAQHLVFGSHSKDSSNVFTINALGSLSNVPQNQKETTTSEYYLNSIFKVACDYLTQLK